MTELQSLLLNNRLWLHSGFEIQFMPIIIAVLRLSFNSGSSSSLTNYCIHNEKKMNPSHEKLGYDASLMRPFLSHGGKTQESGGTWEHHPCRWLSSASPHRSAIQPRSPCRGGQRGAHSVDTVSLIAILQSELL